MATKNSSTTEKRDIYQDVTNQIIEAIEKGVGNWRMPWHTSGKFAFSPVNVITKKAYRGINTLCLWAAAQRKGYDSGEWGTYKQWAAKGAQVRKGEKATLVVFWKFASNREDDETQEGEEKASGSHLVFTRGYSVFNAAQVDGYEAAPEVETPVMDRIALADEFFQQIGATVKHGGNRASYSPMLDEIHMPPFAAFEDPTSYYSTLAHEHTHWTGIEARCNRDLKGRFGDESYAAEELIAELGAAFVLASLGLASEPREDHASYIQSWLKVLKADKRAIFTAASKAQQATDWMLAKAEKWPEAIAA